ncbi:TonB family protein [Zavarzinia aquatilis]|nr:TonB family protein [Zavarzinia aquatilis]
MMSLKPVVVAACVVLPLACGKAAWADGGTKGALPTRVSSENSLSLSESRLRNAWEDDVMTHVRDALVSAGGPEMVDQAGTVTLGLTVSRFGGIRACRVVDSSGDSTLDDHAVKTVCALDLPPMPARLSIEMAELSLPLVFDGERPPEVVRQQDWSIAADQKEILGFGYIISVNNGAGDPMEESPLMRGWVDEFVKLLQDTLVYPPRARIARPSGTVVVEFTVEATGKVKDCVLAGKSGSDTLDNYMMETICDLEMPPLPADLGISEVRLRLPQTFEFRQY